MLDFKLEGRFKDTDYMSVSEAAYFKSLRDTGKITIFKITICKNDDCEKEVPTTKSLCSLKCKNEKEGNQEEEEYGYDETEW